MAPYEPRVDDVVVSHRLGEGHVESTWCPWDYVASFNRPKLLTRINSDQGLKSR